MQFMQFKICDPTPKIVNQIRWVLSFWNGVPGAPRKFEPLREEILDTPLPTGDTNISFKKAVVENGRILPRGTFCQQGFLGNFSIEVFWLLSKYVCFLFQFFFLLVVCFKMFQNMFFML